MSSTIPQMSSTNPLITSPQIPQVPHIYRIESVLSFTLVGSVSVLRVQNLSLSEGSVPGARARTRCGFKWRLPGRIFVCYGAGFPPLREMLYRNKCS